MAKNDFQYGKWNYYTLQCDTIMTLISPGDCTLQCGRWLWDDMPWNSRKRPPYWNSSSGFNFDNITTVHMSFCTSLRNFIQLGPPSAKEMTSCRCSRWRISAILDFRGPIMGSLKSTCMTSYRSPIDIIALTDRQTDGRANRWTGPLRVTSGGGGLTFCRLLSRRHRS